MVGDEEREEPVCKLEDKASLSSEYQLALPSTQVLTLEQLSLNISEMKLLPIFLKKINLP